jgi:class 3 adenylate cyclase
MASGLDEMREERRIVTVLFADIVGSTAITERLDPEDARDVVGGAVALVIEQVDALGGTVKDLAGDGVLALFGAPIAHEDDAERAVLCGLRIIDAIADHAIGVAEGWGLQGFSVRVGIDTGRAVMGRVGGGSRVEYGATGDVLNTAARLQSRAEPGSVLVGASTREMIEDRFTWRQTRSHDLKGKAEPVDAAYVQAYAPRRQGVITPTDRPLVGRAEELARLGTAVEHAREERGAVVVVVGDAGVGKSRLIDEAHRMFDRLGAGTWLMAGAASYAVSIPYLPYRNAILEWLDVPLSARHDEVRAAVEEHADAQPGAKADSLRTLLPTLTGVSVAGADAEAAQEQLFAAVRVLFDELSAECPLVLAFEDLHWSDPTSLALTESLLAMTAYRPLLVLLATRPDQAGLAALQRVTETAAELIRIDLPPLSREGDRELLHLLVGGADLPRLLEERLLDTTDGNPFFLEEQVRGLFVAGALERTDGAQRFVGGADLALAPTVERALIARIDRLAESERRTLLAASVLGLRFEDPLIAAVTETDPQSSLRELVRSEFIVTVANGHVSHRFAHALVQEAAYASLLKRQRRLLHARAAAALESAYAGREQEIAATLGRHLAEAGEAARAVGYLRAAARDAAATFSNQEAATLSRQALALLGTGAIADAERDVAIDLSRIEAAAMRSLARYDEAVAALRRILVLLPVNDRIERARVRSVIGQVLADGHRYEDALVELQIAREIIGERPDTAEAFEVWLAILLASGSAYYWLSDYDRHSEMLHRAEPIVEEYATTEQRLSFYNSVLGAGLRRNRFLISDELAQLDAMLYEANRNSDDQETRAWAFFMHGFSLMWRRDLDDAEWLLRETLVAAEHLGSAMLRSRALTYLMVTARFRGDVERAEELVAPVRQAAREAALPEYEAMASATAAWVAYRRGEQETVREEALQALELWAALPNRYPIDWMACFPLLAVAVVQRDAPQARRWAELMLIAQQQELPHRLATPLRNAVAFSAGRSADAMAQFAEALTRAEELAYL